ncbi:MAG: thiamine pyrophosphate-binding protein [Nitrospinota bacterium]|jgi:thiamine pyrophosphate-dependent acetolactate synthase large subunit-like protein|nr:thiamine pyrophosphate-binding protein [Nitrospinota bacterium]MDP7370127.1 thiamine pyrophosphate-binding protein [Nitrospinota bacterium]MDP7504383.1 thiamine pyrophosphate-binding protein [Nitrospinota bacterium]MDP7664445.1 thiamine pyrophosphate-binding protein [Nitrospinota bacterium]HJP14457.1 thiamine pyrophosphate-binding protein [Nitrospinota bacterium]
MARTGSRALLDALRENGTEHIFGIPGTLTLPFYDALIDFPIEAVVTRHEQGAGFAADAYAKVSGRTGVVFTVPGPGGTNLATPLQSAFEDAVPIVAITAALTDSMRDKSAIHDVDMENALRACVKTVLVPDSVAGIPPAVDAAFKWAAAGRPGPVQVVVKSNLLRAEEERVLRAPEFPLPGDPPAPDEAELDRAAEALLAAKRPVIYAGFGAVAAGCGREIQLLASKLGAPVVTSVKGRGILSEKDPLNFGVATFEGCEDMLSEADVCLAVGTGFGQFATQYYRMPVPGNLIQIDIDPGRLGRNYPARQEILADALSAMTGLLKRLEMIDDRPPGEGHFRVRTSKSVYAERLRAYMDRPAAPPFDGLFVMKTIRDAFSPDTIFISDSSHTQSWLMEQALEIYRPRSVLLSEAYQSMGYAVSAAYGAKLGAPERPVCVIVGDGSFVMACGELAAAVSLGVDLTYVIFNDGHYGALRHSQKHVYGERYIGVELNSPDFAALAAAFGAKGRRVGSGGELAEALSVARAGGGVHVIDCPMDKDALSSRWQRTVKIFTADPGSSEKATD